MTFPAVHDTQPETFNEKAATFGHHATNSCGHRIPDPPRSPSLPQQQRSLRLKKSLPTAVSGTGEAFVFLETLLGQMATKGHGVDTLKTASKQLEILKKTSRKVKHRGVVERSRVADGGGKARDTSRASSLSSSPPPASAVGTPRIGRDGATASSRARQRRPLRRASPPLTGNDPGTTLDHDHDGNDDNDEEKGNGQRRGRGGNQGRRAAISVTGQVAQGDGAADENTVSVAAYKSHVSCLPVL